MKTFIVVLVPSLQCQSSRRRMLGRNWKTKLLALQPPAHRRPQTLPYLRVAQKITVLRVSWGFIQLCFVPPLAVIDFAMVAVEWSVFTVDGRAVRDLKLGVLCPVDALYILRIRKTYFWRHCIQQKERMVHMHGQTRTCMRSYWNFCQSRIGPIGIFARAVYWLGIGRKARWQISMPTVPYSGCITSHVSLFSLFVILVSGWHEFM